MDSAIPLVPPGATWGLSPAKICVRVMPGGSVYEDLQKSSDNVT